MTLQFYSNGNDTVIAESVEDAITVWENTTGERWSDYEDEEEWELLDLSPNEVVRVTWVADLPTASEVPEGGYIEQPESGGYAHIAATAEQWIKHNGRGYFSCSEW